MRNRILWILAYVVEGSIEVIAIVGAYLIVGFAYVVHLVKR